MSTLHPVTLTFRSANLEQSYMTKTFPRTLMQGRVGLIVGTLLYLLFGLLDRWTVSNEQQMTVWAIRLGALTVPIAVYILTFTRHFKIASHLWLASLGLAANTGFLLILPLVPFAQLGLFYPSIALTAVANYCLVGTRFVYALAVEMFVLIGYNIVFLQHHGFIAADLLTSDFFILCANIIGGGAGYMQERQNRILFLRERELEQERQKHLDRSLHDPLTGLPNRDLLHDRLNQALSESHRDNNTHACFFIDLDGFKKINDEHGHDLGDKVLRAVAALLKLSVREADTAARLGGDEFFVLCRNVENELGAQLQAQRLIDAIETCCASWLPKGALSASVGICMVPFDGITIEDVIARADKAMYQAKQNRPGKFAMAAKQPSVLTKVLD
jgi:diguanylate cyclase